MKHPRGLLKIHTIIFQQKYLSERMDMALKSCRGSCRFVHGTFAPQAKVQKNAMSVPCNTNMVKCAKLYKGIMCGSLADLKPDEEQVLNPNPRAWFLLTAKVCKAAVTANDRHRNNLRKIAPYPLWISNFLQWVLTYSQAYYWVAGTQMPRTYRGLHCVNRWVSR